jgi:hypothetical protein
MLVTGQFTEISSFSQIKHIEYVDQNPMVKLRSNVTYIKALMILGFIFQRKIV